MSKFKVHIFDKDLSPSGYYIICKKINKCISYIRGLFRDYSAAIFEIKKDSSLRTLITKNVNPTFNVIIKLIALKKINICNEFLL